MDQINPLSPAPTYGGYLKQLRLARGFTDLKDFAKAVYGEIEKPNLHTQMSNLGNWEADRFRPQGASLGKLANALKVSPHSINPKHFKASWMNRLAIMKPLAGKAGDETSDGATPFVLNTLLDSLPEEIRPGFGEAFSAYVKRMRLLRGIPSPNALSSKLKANGGGGNMVVQRIENGQSKPMQETSARLAEVLDLPYALMDKALYDRLQEQGDEATETYGEYLSRLRRGAGYMTQVEFAKAWSEKFGIGVDGISANVNKWETDRSFPSTTSLDKLAQMFGISVRTLDPKRFVPGRLLPPTLKVVEPEPTPAPAPEEVDVEAVTTPPEMLNNGMDIGTADVQWEKGGEPSVPTLREEFGGMPQFLKQHVDVLGLSKTDDPDYVRIRFDAVVLKKTAGGMMRELVRLTTDDLLGTNE